SVSGGPSGPLPALLTRAWRGAAGYRRLRACEEQTDAVIRSRPNSRRGDVGRLRLLDCLRSRSAPRYADWRACALRLSPNYPLLFEFAQVGRVRAVARFCTNRTVHRFARSSLRTPWRAQNIADTSQTGAPTRSSADRSRNSSP